MAIKSVKKAKRRIFVYYLGIIGLIIALVFTVPNYLFQIVNKNRELSDYQDSLVSLEKKEDELKTEVLQLQDPAYIAMIARQKYLFSKDGEWILKIETPSNVVNDDSEEIDFYFYFKWTAMIVGSILGLLFVIVFLRKILKKPAKEVTGKHEMKKS